MLPEPWQRVQHLVLICPGLEAEMLPPIAAIQQIFPRATVSVLVPPGVIPDLPGLWDVVHHSLLTEKKISPSQIRELVGWFHDRRFDAAILFTPPHQSPYPLAYLCYLAGIPLRLGQSPEFGGGVLSPWVRSEAPLEPTEHYRFLLASAGLMVDERRCVEGGV